MIRLCKGEEPCVLVENRETWTAEYVSWRNTREGREPSRYRHPDIRSSLEAETRAKCAYCEGRIKDVAYPNIEHKLPKIRCEELVCDWQNLTIACPRCNTNKGDYYDPDCPLLDPYVDNVEEEIAFSGPAARPRGGTRAKRTIDVIDLNRFELFNARKDVLDLILSTLEVLGHAAHVPAAVEALWLQIDSRITATAEYSSACRQFVEWQIEERGLCRP